MRDAAWVYLKEDAGDEAAARDERRGAKEDGYGSREGSVRADGVTEKDAREAGKWKRVEMKEMEMGDPLCRPF